MRIQRGCVVDVEVILRDAEGAIVEASSPEAPLTYVHGAGEIDAGLERMLEGLDVGDRCEAVLAPGPASADDPEDPTAGRALRVEARVRGVSPPADAAGLTPWA